MFLCDLFERNLDVLRNLRTHKKLQMENLELIFSRGLAVEVESTRFNFSDVDRRHLF